MTSTHFPFPPPEGEALKRILSNVLLHKLGLFDQIDSVYQALDGVDKAFNDLSKSNPEGAKKFLQKLEQAIETIK